MGNTNALRDRRRTERWIKRSGGLPYVSPEAFDLLSRRLAARRAATVRCAPLLVVAVGVYLSLGFNFRSLGDSSWNRVFATRILATYAVLAVAGLLIRALTIRAERRIAQALPSRTSRATAVPLRMMLGAARTTFLVGAIAVEGGLAVTLLVVHRGWVAWTYLGAYLVVSGFVTFGVRQAARRATVAVDPISLTIDERLRSEEAYAATTPLFLLVIAFPGGLGQSGPAWLDLVWLLAVMSVSLLSGWASLAKPWQKSLRPWIPVTPAAGDLTFAAKLR